MRIREKKKFSLRIVFLTTCIITAGLFCCSALADGFFSPLEEIPSMPAGAANIYLDSSQIEHPILKGIFPNPSEYKAKNSIPVDAFSPAEPEIPVLKTTYKVDNPENPKEIQVVNSNEEEVLQDPNFTNLEFFTPPSQYTPASKTAVKAKTAEKELPPLDEIKEIANYHASAETQRNEDFSEFEGKTISSITISGLNHLNENTVLNVISSRNGATFNPERLQKDLQNIYNLGFFTDVMHVDPTLNDNDTVALEFIVQENPVVNQVKISGNTVFTEDELLSFAKGMVGLPQNLHAINNSIEKINDYYKEQGYILAKVTSVDDTSEGVLSLGVTEGVIEKITFEGAKKTKDYVIQRNIMTRPGAVYNEEMLKKDLSKIYATKIFDEVERKIEPSPNSEGEYIVTIVVKEASSDSISIGGGIDTALGAFGQIAVTDKNFMGRGQQLGLSGMIGSGILLSDSSIKNRMNYQIEMNFKEPYFLNADNSLMSKLYLRELGSYQIPLAIERRFGANAVVTHKVKNNERLTTNLGIGFENIHLKEGDLGRITQQYAIRGINFAYREKQLTGGDFLNIAPGVQYNTLDNEFMPREGMLAKANFTESISVGDLHKTSGRLAGSVTKYIPILKKSTLAIGTKGGIKVHGDHMPEVMAFNLGGPYTVRGFRMSGVGTGEAFLMGSAELQTPLPFMDRIKYDVFKNLRLAFFIDAGKIWDPTISSALYDRPNDAITAGVGLRINIPGLGPISVDYGLPLTNVGHYNKQHGYFTFGTGGLYDSY